MNKLPSLLREAWTARAVYASISSSFPSVAQKKHLTKAKNVLTNSSISPCKHGKEHTISMIMIMIHIVSFFATLQNTVTSASQLLGASQEAIRRHVMIWYDKQEIRQPCKKCGQGSSCYGDNNHILNHQHLASITKFVVCRRQ